QQPGGGTGGVAWATQPKVTIQDALGNTDTTSSASGSLAITSGTRIPFGVLTCTTNPKAAASGVVSFTGCKINLPGTGYTLTAIRSEERRVGKECSTRAVGPATKDKNTQQPTAAVAVTTINPVVRTTGDT